MKAVVGCVSWMYNWCREMVSMDTGHPEAFLSLKRYQNTWRSALGRSLPPEADWPAIFVHTILLGVGWMVRGWFQECWKLIKWDNFTSYMTIALSVLTCSILETMWERERLCAFQGGGREGMGRESEELASQSLQGAGTSAHK